MKEMTAMSVPPSLPEAFLRPNDTARRNEDRREGQAIFWRLDDGDRLRLAEELIWRWRDEEFLNRAATAGAFRAAWDGEPYLHGTRWGSYFSALAVASDGCILWTKDEIAEDWGDEMMTDDERRLLERTDFPLTVYRGGVGDPERIAQGASWTTDVEVARFFALTWPKRWGSEEPSHVLSARIERCDAVALFVDRQEAEILVDGGVPFDRTLRMPLDAS